MARYVTLASWANELRMPEVSKLIAATLEEDEPAQDSPLRLSLIKTTEKGLASASG